MMSRDRVIREGVRRPRLLLLAGVAAVLPVLSCINPQVLNKSSGGLYPLAPGDQPFVLVTFLNDTTANISAQLLVDVGRTEPNFFFFQNFSPGEHTQGVLIP